jgi:hypothetical protein
VKHPHCHPELDSGSVLKIGMNYDSGGLALPESFYL